MHLKKYNNKKTKYVRTFYDDDINKNRNNNGNITTLMEHLCLLVLVFVGPAKNIFGIPVDECKFPISMYLFTFSWNDLKQKALKLSLETTIIWQV